MNLIMHIEDQVCSLDLAKKLKESGIRQESIFSWIRTETPAGIEGWSVCHRALIPSPEQRAESCAAFTSAELGRIMPKIIVTDIWEYLINPGWLVKDRYGAKEEFWKVSIIMASKKVVDEFISANEADARAMALVWLIENRLVNPS